MNPQSYDYVMEKLFGMDVLEVFLTPILMKKNRPATLLTVICPSERLGSVIDFILEETTTLGVRWREEERSCAGRKIVSIRTGYGEIRFKMATWGGNVVNLAPEYEDCKRLALKNRVPLKKIFEEANRAAMIFHGSRYKNPSYRRR